MIRAFIPAQVIARRAASVARRAPTSCSPAAWNRGGLLPPSMRREAGLGVDDLQRHDVLPW